MDRRILMMLVIASSQLLNANGMSYCTEGMHECDSGKCIPPQWTCDGEPDCLDLSDENEELCNKTVECDAVDDFECANHHQCVPRRWTCDGEADCSDHSDEFQCWNITCEDDHIRCGAGLPCIHISFICDDNDDCANGYDELNTTCAVKKCAADEFKCSEGHHCISTRWLCDGDSDCPTESVEQTTSDELHCDKFVHMSCSVNQWLCNHGNQCILSQLRCNGIDDCGDDSDEMNCSIESPVDSGNTGGIEPPCDSKEFRCTTSHECIHGAWYCDGDVDCADSSDEHNCTTERTCSPDQYQCRNDGNCIPQILYCDGVVHCDDRSDEYQCLQIVGAQCNISQFDCSLGVGPNRFCIDVKKVCNNHNDCGKSQDENATLCARNKSKKCCINNPKTTNACAGPHNGGCAHECVENEVRQFCRCHHGYRLAPDNKTCDDINECEIPGSCSQLCKNFRGHFKCSCTDDYELDIHDHVTCHAKGEEPFLLLADGHGVREYKVRSGEYRQFIGGLHSIKFFDYDLTTGVTYVAQALVSSDRHYTHQWSIFAITMNNFSSAFSYNRTLLVSHGIQSVGGFALDWVSSAIYWTDSWLGQLSVVTIPSPLRATIVGGEEERGKWQRTLFTALDVPGALVLDPRLNQRWMYWTQGGAAPCISKAAMDGSSKEDIVRPGSHIIAPTGLTIDYYSERLYWVDSKLHVIMSLDLMAAALEMGHITKIAISYTHFASALALAVFEDSLYWSDRNRQSLLIEKTGKFPLDSRTSPVANASTVVSSVGSAAADIRIYHRLRQPIAVDVRITQAHCSHICLPRLSAPGYSCSCPDSNDTAIYVIDPMASNNCIVNLVRGDRTSSTILMVIISIVAVAVLVAVALGILHSYLRSFHRKSMNFDNPLYCKRSENQFHLATTGNVDENHQYQTLEHDSELTYIISSTDDL